MRRIFLFEIDDEDVADGGIGCGRASRGCVAGVGRQHVVELGHLEVRIADHRVVGCGALRLLDVGGPALVIVDRVDADPEDLDAALVELRLHPRHRSKLSRADRREVLGMGEQNRPAAPDPVVKLDMAFCGIGLEVRCRVAKSQGHRPSSPQVVQNGDRPRAGYARNVAQVVGSNIQAPLLSDGGILGRQQDRGPRARVPGELPLTVDKIRPPWGRPHPRAWPVPMDPAFQLRGRPSLGPGSLASAAWIVSISSGVSSFSHAQASGGDFFFSAR